ncbi:MAG: hypothetical protein ACPGSL_03405 [Vicingaceae bacterium]
MNKAILKSVDISLNEDRVLLIKFKDGSDVDIEETKKIMSLSAEMIGAKPFTVLIDAMDIFASVDHKSRKYMAEHEVNNFNMAQAMVVNNMPVRIIANFYLKFYKHAYPMKVFSDIEVARKWLLQQANSY